MMPGQTPSPNRLNVIFGSHNKLQFLQKAHVKSRLSLSNALYQNKTKIVNPRYICFKNIKEDKCQINIINDTEKKVFLKCFRSARVTG